jgi:hypothetical protein
MACRILTALFWLLPALAAAQPTVAREWNEVLLEGIRNDFARPTIHARNLFHVSAAMYDAWAAYDETAQPFLLGRQVGAFPCAFEGVPAPADREAAREKALSYAAWRLIRHRFAGSPGAGYTLPLADALLIGLGYDPAFASTRYQDGDPAALGNYIAEQYIAFGFQDGANEQEDYSNLFYQPVNAPLDVRAWGNPSMSDPNRWQPLAFDIFIDQGGNVSGNVPAFLSPEWGRLTPFALQASDRQVFVRDGQEYVVYHDPGPPPYLQADGQGGSADYQWNFALVSAWSSHLDPNDGVMWDISPASLGNIESYPQTAAEMRAFYDLEQGGDPSRGHALNPRTGQPYAPQRVPRGDYARVLAEFWADGPHSETPPGHWFTILNYVCDQPALTRRMGGAGPSLGPLEWDVKCYFALGGAMHDAAVCTWGIKGWYDYTRPLSALRYMAEKGQSSDPLRPRYSPEGLPLIPGFIEQVRSGDPLEGFSGENVGKIKLYAWRGASYITDPKTDTAGVGWILAESWMPYQRPTFVTPPFAGYISGHSTYSSAAAEMLTLLTGDPFFPGGMGEFIAKKNEYLVFEEGPSVDVRLQWATYRDASDQTSLSRIWGGIHPPVDDIPGRRIGIEIGTDAYVYAQRFFSGEAGQADLSRLPEAYPNPLPSGGRVSLYLQPLPKPGELRLLDLQGRVVQRLAVEASESRRFYTLETGSIAPGLYLLQIPSSPVRALKLLVQ